ncbi:MAG: class I SAM-dependent methyltransferase [Miltoncostaeaceae bacterium]
MRPGAGPHEELWQLWEDGHAVVSLPVRVTFGKQLDIRGFRSIDAAGHRLAADEVARAARELHSDGGADWPSCPCCGAPPSDEPVAHVAGVSYAGCAACGHAFLARPEPAVLTERFRASDQIAAVYTDPAAAAFRMRCVVEPKLEWAVEAARRASGREPASVLEIGAGAGHFVSAARSRGLRAEGYEVNESCCGFAREELGVSLRNVDVLDAEDGGERYDIVTLWGVLEYVPDPVAVIGRASGWLASDGLMVIEVPRVESLSTGVQRLMPDHVARHMSPASHLNVFSDASLATALWAAGLGARDAWYFGMDAFELASQLVVADGIAEETVDALLGLQADLDRARFVDDIVVGATAVGTAP